MTRSFAWSSLIAFAVLNGCGSQPPPPAGAPSSTPPAETPTDAASQPDPLPPDLAWSDMNDQQKEQHMRQTVLPNMRELFTSFDPSEFPDVTCDTCHGAGAEDKGEFEMPNAELPALDPTGGFAAAKKEHPKETELMIQRVVPTMATLLNEQPYDPATQEGFGCFDCHTRAK